MAKKEVKRKAQLRMDLLIWMARQEWNSKQDRAVGFVDRGESVKHHTDYRIELKRNGWQTRDNNDFFLVDLF